MPDYKKMYFQLAAKVADAVELLIEAQRKGEDRFVEDENAVLTLLPDANKEAAFPPEAE